MKAIPQNMSRSKDNYKIVINKKMLKKWRLFESEIPEVMHKCKSFLEKNPEDRLKSGGKLKKLKGKFDGFLQYDINAEARVMYEVDRVQRIVRIKYFGHHK